MDILIRTLREREKELRCLYQIQRLTLSPVMPLETVFEKIASVVGSGWQHPETAGCRIEYYDQSYASANFDPQAPGLTEPIRIGGQPIGSISVSDPTAADSEDFLTEESILLETISWLLTNFVEWRHLGILGQRLPASQDGHWHWRERLLDGIKEKFDQAQFGAAEICVGGSTERGEANHDSIIELYVSHQGSELEKERLRWWLDGWSHSMAELARIQTGETFAGGVVEIVWLDDAEAVRPPHCRRLL